MRLLINVNYVIYGHARTINIYYLPCYITTNNFGLMDGILINRRTYYNIAVSREIKIHT